jgi:hypothetical protein
MTSHQNLQHKLNGWLCSVSGQQAVQQAVLFLRWQSQGGAVSHTVPIIRGNLVRSGRGAEGLQGLPAGTSQGLLRETITTIITITTEKRELTITSEQQDRQQPIQVRVCTVHTLSASAGQLGRVSANS